MDPLTTVKDLNSLIIPPPTQQWFLILYRYWAIPTSENADRYLFMGHTVTPKEFDISFPLDFPGGSDGKASVYNVGDLGSSPGLGRSPEKEMAIHSSTITWKIPWTEESGRLQSVGSQRVRHD